MPTTFNLSAEDPGTTNNPLEEGSSDDNTLSNVMMEASQSVDSGGEVTAESAVMAEPIHSADNYEGSEVSSTVQDPVIPPQDAATLPEGVSTLPDTTTTDNHMGEEMSEPDPSTAPPTNVSKGFQDAFAAFASAALQEPEEEMDVGIGSSEILQEKTSSSGNDPEQTSQMMALSDTNVSSEINSSHINITNDPNALLEQSGQLEPDVESGETALSSSEQSDQFAQVMNQTQQLSPGMNLNEQVAPDMEVQQVGTDIGEAQQGVPGMEQNQQELPTVMDPTQQVETNMAPAEQTDPGMDPVPQAVPGLDPAQLAAQVTDPAQQVAPVTDPAQQVEPVTDPAQQVTPDMDQAEPPTSGIGQHQQVDQVGTDTVSEQPQDSVYFIQGADATGQIVTSIIDPNDIGSYLDHVVYKQCMMPNGEIETTIVHSGTSSSTQEQQQQLLQAEEQQQQQEEQQIIYAHDLNGQLTPIDTSQSANDVAPPGKQFVYMQDSTGRIIRTIMDANQTMVPGQQVYYTQSDDGRIITSVMDPSSGGPTEEQAPQQPQQQPEVTADNTAQVTMQQQLQQTPQDDVTGASNYNIDSALSGLNMLAELSHLTAGQAPTASGLPSENKGTSSTDSNSADMDEFRPVAMITRKLGTDGVEEVSSTIASLSVDQQESSVYKLISELKPEHQSPSLSVSRDNLFVQWQNLDAMCWMDVVLIMLVYSPTLRPLVNLDPGHELASTLLITLLKANRQAQVLVQNLLKKSNGAEITELQTGAGNTATTSMQDPKTAKLVCKENMDEIGKAINILYAMREKIWQALQPRLRCERGKHNSPVLVLPLLVREKPAVKQMFTMSYRYVFKCGKCGYAQDDNHTKILPSIPAVPEDFNMKEPCFVRNCFECHAPNQRMMMKFEGLQDFVQMHFVKGLPHNRFDELSFDFNGDHYEVTAVVHYKNNPDHFIAWVRNAPGSLWMECDDLKSVMTRYQYTSPPIPPSQVHMVLWERRLNPVHQLQMRDTEDTKVLSSLVLTVQQPSTHQTSDPAAKPTGQPSTAGLLTQPPTKTSTLLSGVLTQNQVFSPYTPRGPGRGRGSRGRGSRGGRELISATSTPTIRRSAPITLGGTNSPQIVRLPMSALGATSQTGTTKYVLMGGNSGNSSGPSGTASKVVVVRSQGGASNLTPQQLLQLLQQTGAINQDGAKFAIANTPQSSGTTKASTSYIIQSDGTVVTTSAPVSTATEPLQSSAQISQTVTTNGATETAQTLSDPKVKLVSVLPSALASLTSTYGNMSSTASSVVDQQSDIAESTAEGVPAETAQTEALVENEAPQTPSQQQADGETVADNQQTTETNPILVSPETPNTSVDTSSTTAVNPTSSTASRYIQIPTSDGGSILTQLVVRNGKMVLVPVDKATQALAQAQPSSVLKLSGTAKMTMRTATTTTTTTAPSTISQDSLLPQQHQQMDSTAISSSSGTLGATTLLTKGSQGYITVPNTQASPGKRTIQLISVPRGSGQLGSKTIILNPNSSVAAGTSAEPAASTVTNTNSVTGDAGGTQGRILSQEGNIVIRELQRPDTSPATLTTTLVGTQTGSISLLKDISASPSTQGAISLLGSGQRQSDTFKYILPGSNTTHVLHTGSTGGTGTGGRAFTALSSSGTIIGGQLTVNSASTSTMDHELGLSDPQEAAGFGIPQEAAGFGMDIDYFTSGRGKTRGVRGSRGVRGARRARGSGGRGRGSRGRGRASSQLWSSMEMMTPGVAQGMSTLSELRQVGAHVIESGTENVDGVPVLSIPEFPEAGQTEANVAAESIQENTQLILDSSGVLGQTNESQEQSQQQDWSSPEAVTQSPSKAPRVITQSIPSVKANHGFDILTQGILGSSTGMLPPQQNIKKGRTRSLLTGAEVTTSIASAEALQHSLDLSHTSHQQGHVNETDTLIEAAMAAAKSQHVDAVDSQLLQEDQDVRHVSAAERYSMPMELFQPDDECTEKAVKLTEQQQEEGEEQTPEVEQMENEGDVQQARQVRQGDQYIDMTHSDQIIDQGVQQGNINFDHQSGELAPIDENRRNDETLRDKVLSEDGELVAMEYNGDKTLVEEGVFGGEKDVRDTDNVEHVNRLTTEDMTPEEKSKTGSPMISPVRLQSPLHSAREGQNQCQELEPDSKTVIEEDPSEQSGTVTSQAEIDSVKQPEKILENVMQESGDCESSDLVGATDLRGKSPRSRGRKRGRRSSSTRGSKDVTNALDEKSVSSNDMPIDPSLIQYGETILEPTDIKHNAPLQEASAALEQEIESFKTNTQQTELDPEMEQHGKGIENSTFERSDVDAKVSNKLSQNMEEDTMEMSEATALAHKGKNARGYRGRKRGRKSSSNRGSRENHDSQIAREISPNNTALGSSPIQPEETGLQAVHNEDKEDEKLKWSEQDIVSSELNRLQPEIFSETGNDESPLDKVRESLGHVLSSDGNKDVQQLEKLYDQDIDESSAPAPSSKGKSPRKSRGWKKGRKSRTAQVQEEVISACSFENRDDDESNMIQPEETAEPVANENIVKVPTSRTAGGFGADVLREMDSSHTCSIGVAEDDDQVDRGVGVDSILMTSPDKDSKNDQELDKENQWEEVPVDVQQNLGVGSEDTGEKIALDTLDSDSKTIGDDRLKIPSPHEELEEDGGIKILQSPLKDISEEKKSLGPKKPLSLESNSIEQAATSMVFGVLKNLKRKAVDWSIPWGPPEKCVFNYRVLGGHRKLVQNKRHKGIFMLREKKYHMKTSGVAKVTRLRKKQLQKPVVDPSKDSIVVPLLAEGEEDCTGGSVITSPKKGETFVGVLGKQKKEEVDWAYYSSLKDEDQDWENNWTSEELCHAQEEFRQHLMFLLFLKAGDLSFIIDYDTDGDLETDDPVAEDDSMRETSSLIYGQAETTKEFRDAKSELQEVGNVEPKPSSEGVEEPVKIQSSDQHQVVKRKRGRPSKSKASNVAISSPGLTASDTPPSKHPRTSSSQESCDESTNLEAMEQSMSAQTNAEDDSMRETSSLIDGQAETSKECRDAKSELQEVGNVEPKPSSEGDEEPVKIQSSDQHQVVKRKRGRPSKSKASNVAISSPGLTASDTPPSKRPRTSSSQESCDESTNLEAMEQSMSAQTNGNASPHDLADEHSKSALDTQGVQTSQKDWQTSTLSSDSDFCGYSSGDSLRRSKQEQQS